MNAGTMRIGWIALGCKTIEHRGGSAVGLGASINRLRKNSWYRLLRLIAPFIAVVLLQAFVAGLSLNVVSSVRAYVAGESLWSRSQKNAIYSLHLYLNSGDPAFFADFRKAIAVPLGDGIARRALEQQVPDIELAAAVQRLSPQTRKNRKV